MSKANKDPKEDQSSLYISYGLLAIIFVIDVFQPLSIFGGIPYVVGMILVMWFLKPHEVLRFGVFCGLAALFGFFLSEDLSADMEGLMNRFMAIFTIVAIALLVRRHTEIEQEFDKQQKLFDSVIEKRTDGLKQAVDQYDEAKIRLAEAEELGHFGFWEYYPSNGQMIWSNGVFSIYGRALVPQAPSFEEFLDQCHTEDVQTLHRSIQYGISEKKPYTVEYRLILPDGKQKWIYNRGRPIIDKRGRIEMLVGTIQDITSQKQSEESVVANRARYTTIFKSAAVAKALIIPNKRILEINPAFSRWIGYHERELLKIPVEKLMHKADRSMEDAYARDMIAGELSFYQKEKRFIRRDGQVIWGLFSVAPVVDVKDKISCFAVEIVDITTQKRAEAARAKAEAAWHDAEEALTEAEANLRLMQTERPSGEAGQSEAEDQVMAEEVINHIFEMASDLMVLIGEDGYYRRISSHFAEVLGYDVDKLEDEQFIDFIHKADSEKVNTHLKALFAGEKVTDLTLRHSTSAGSYTTLTMTATYNASHEVAYVVFRQQTQIQRAVDSPAPPIHETDQVEPLVSRETDADQSVKPLRDTVSVRRVLDEEPEIDAWAVPATSQVLPPAAREAERGEDLQHESRDILEPARSESDLILPEEPDAVEDEPKLPQPPSDLAIEVNAVSNTSGNATDSHDRVRAARPVSTPREPLLNLMRANEPSVKPAIKRTDKSTRNITVDWRRLTDKMPFQIWMLDKDRHCRYANKKVRDFTGLPFEQLEGTGRDKALHPEDYRKYVAYYNTAFDRQEPMQYTYRLRRADSAYRWMQETAMPLLDANNEFEGYLVTCMEISALRAVDKKFTRALEGALNLEDIRSVLMQCRKDDCQHTLTDSIKVADALIDNAKQVPHPDVADLMTFAGHHLLERINKVLHFATRHDDAREVKKRSVSVKQVVDNTLLMLEPLRRQDGPRFQLRPEDAEKDFVVMADKMLMHRIFETLMRSLQERAESRVMRVELDQGQDVGQVTIRHLGPIISRAFPDDPSVLYRTKGGATQFMRFAGLELLLMRRVIQLLDGAFVITQDKEDGPVIKIGLQLETPEPVSVASSSVASEPALVLPEPGNGGDALHHPENAINLEGMVEPDSARAKEKQLPDDEILVQDTHNGDGASRHRVLIGEMNSETQRLIRSLLQPYYDLKIVPNTDDLLKEADQMPYDLLLVDVHLQGGHSGVDVLRELRSRPKYHRTPAIAVAAGTSAEDQKALIDRAGFDGFLRKPYSIVELLETVERMIES